MTIRDMVARHSHPNDNQKDYIPTPLYATRVLFEEVAPQMKRDAAQLSIWDPAAGDGHMVRVFHEYGFRGVRGTDIRHSPPLDFRDVKAPDDTMDCIVTNPPYGDGLIDVFLRRGLALSNKHFAVLVRVQAIEGQRRYNQFFKHTPPTRVAFFSDRIPFRVGRLDRKASKMFFHVWLYWDMEKLTDGRTYTTDCVWVSSDAITKYGKPGDWE